MPTDLAFFANGIREPSSSYSWAADGPGGAFDEQRTSIGDVLREPEVDQRRRRGGVVEEEDAEHVAVGAIGAQMAALMPRLSDHAFSASRAFSAVM